jgi:ferredoxin hydrogenase gamma subunit
MFAIDQQAAVCQSHNNPQVKALYDDFLKAPCSEMAHHLLHT